MLLMEAEPFLRSQLLFASQFVVIPDTVQPLQHVTALLWKTRRYFHELAPSMGEAVGQQQLHHFRQFRGIPRQRVAPSKIRPGLARARVTVWSVRPCILTFGVR